MPMKIVLMFNQVNRGWTETYYSPADNPPGKVEDDVLQIVKASVKFRNHLTVLWGIRFSQMQAPFKSVFYPLSSKFTSGDGGSPEEPDPVSTDGVWNLRGQNYSRRQVSIRGLDDNQIIRHSATGTDLPTAKLLKAVDQYFGSMVQAGWQIRVQKNPNNSALSFFNVLQIRGATFQGAPVSAIRTVQALPGGLVVGQGVRFQGPYKAFMPQFPRVQKILGFVAGAQPEVYMSWRPPNEADVYNPINVKFIPAEYIFQNMSAWDFVRFSERKTGGPFGRLRGRTSPVKLRR